LYDQPTVDKKKKRVTGPFTVEAVPSQRVLSFEHVEKSCPTEYKQRDWIDEMLATGIRGKNKQKILFDRIDTQNGTTWVHAVGQMKDGGSAAISFGPQYAPLEQRQVELAIKEAQTLVPRPKLVIFASFQFDPEAAKDIDDLRWPGVTALKVQMNTDLLTSDLKKKRSSSESYMLMGQPDVEIKRSGTKFVVEVRGFDYYDPTTGDIISKGTDHIAMWELDTDYDGRSLYPRQVFFPGRDGWDKLAKNLKAVLDEDLMEQYRGCTSIPFKMGENKQVAVKIIDDRGIESLRVLRI
jgi:adenine-specific DNA-methyltransferase